MGAVLDKAVELATRLDREHAHPGLEQERDPASALNAFRRFLQGLTDQQLHALEGVMYAGNTGSSWDWLDKRVDFTSREDTIDNLTEKANAGWLLTEGRNVFGTEIPDSI